jgi:glycosyltransferase involved in cell wall biosynthesis
MKLSLVVPTVERTTELSALFEGLAAQPFRDFEVILVDQNGDDRLVPIVARFSSLFPLRHMRSNVRNASNARNIGLFAAEGEVTGFPDDDCLYKPDTMIRVMEHFIKDPELVTLAGNCVSETGARVNGRWTDHSCVIDDKTVWTTIMGPAMWMRTAETQQVGGWSMEIGPGTPWGSSEEPDLILKLLRRGYKGWYDVTLGVYHPDKQMTPHAAKRAFTYGAGMGRVLRKHGIAKGIALPYFIRPIGGLLLSMARGRRMHARYYWETFRGRLHGYRAPLA